MFEPEQINPGFFIGLYKRLISGEVSPASWQAFLSKHKDEFSEHFEFYRRLKKTNLLEIEEIESHALFSLQHFNDYMLLHFQREYENIGGTYYRGIEMTTEDYLDFWTHTLPFDHKRVKLFHPFYCEIVEVIESDDDEVEIIEEKWPCIMLGSLLFSRAGVVIRAPRESGLIHGIADRSLLYNSTLRHYRPRSDPSDGWGHNSMWRTRFRVVRVQRAKARNTFELDIPEAGAAVLAGAVAIFGGTGRPGGLNATALDGEESGKVLFHGGDMKF